MPNHVYGIIIAPGTVPVGAGSEPAPTKEMLYGFLTESGDEVALFDGLDRDAFLHGYAGAP
jgi:hypothetical protein